MKKYLCLTIASILLIISNSFGGILRKSDSLYPRMMEAKSAMEILQSAKPLKASPYWPNVNPASFTNNLEQNLKDISDLFQGSHTNFCGYAALSYIIIQERPVEYIESMLSLYKNGFAIFEGFRLKPSEGVRQFTGKISHKGKLDQHPADQMWFMTLADCIKGYSNWTDMNFQPGDENHLWAAVNLAKFNKTLCKMLKCEYSSKGSDLIRPGLKKPVPYVQNKLEKGWVVLYLNNRSLHPTSHKWIRPSFPDHYIVVSEIQETKNGNIQLTYWDYGGMRRTIISSRKFRKIVYAVTVFYNHITPANQARP